MSIYSKPISQIDTADLQELLSEKGVESVRLEFKREPPSKDDTLKKLSSFANAYGGYLVVGAEAGSKDGRIVGLPGVDRQPSYKQTVVQWCSEGASPPLSVEVSDPIAAPSGGDKVCYVIYTPESELAPHFLNGRRGVYIRTDEFSGSRAVQFANEAELRHLLDRRRLIRERRESLIARARRRFESYTGHKYHELNPRRESIGARFDLSLVPRYPARPVCDHSRLLSLLKQSTIEWRKTYFPRDPAMILSQHESAIALGASSRFSMLEANTWGLLFYAIEVEEQTNNYSGIHMNQFIGHLLVFVRHASRMSPDLGCAGPLRVEMKMQGIRGVPWIWFPRERPEQGGSSELDDEFEFSHTTTTHDLVQNEAGLTRDLLAVAFFAMNRPDLVNTPAGLDKLVSMGHEYNFWPPVAG